MTGRWFTIRKKHGNKERNALLYARRFTYEDEGQQTTVVHLSNGAYVNFVCTPEEARERYETLSPVSPQRDKEISDRWDYEIDR